jgi:hypothetical protein
MQGKTDANVPRNSSTQEGSVPFFTRFLEGQNNDHLQAADGITQACSNGNQDELLQTLKYPSDRDEIDFR